MTELERLIKEVDTYDEDREALVNGNVFYAVSGADWDGDKGNYNDEIMCPGDMPSGWHALHLENRGLLGILGLNSKALAESYAVHFDEDDMDEDEEMVPVYFLSDTPDSRVVKTDMTYLTMLSLAENMEKYNKKIACLSNLITSNTIEMDSTKNVSVKMLAEIVDVLRENGYEASVENKYTVFNKMETYSSDRPAEIHRMRTPENIHEFDGIMFNVGNELVDDVDKLYEVGEKIKNIIKEYY